MSDASAAAAKSARAAMVVDQFNLALGFPVYKVGTHLSDAKTEVPYIGAKSFLR